MTDPSQLTPFSRALEYHNSINTKLQLGGHAAAAHAHLLNIALHMDTEIRDLKQALNIARGCTGLCGDLYTCECKERAFFDELAGHGLVRPSSWPKPIKPIKPLEKCTKESIARALHIEPEQGEP